MKKLNKKGFTLAELLIVIAIIAILIAIAIPVFAGQLDNAKLQTDHANIRSAYAQAQVANLEGVIYTGADGTPVTLSPTSTDKYVFQQDGSISVGKGANPYITKTKGSMEKCSASPACTRGKTGSGADASNHVADVNIVIKYDTSSSSWIVSLENAA